jgi:hypothetical protein
MKYDEVSKGMTRKEVTYQQKELCLHGIPDSQNFLRHPCQCIPASAEVVLVFHAVNQVHKTSMGSTVTPVLLDRSATRAFPGL